MARRVTIVTAGHLATCPRMVKAADALHQCGYAVRVVSVQHTPWACQGDAAIRQTRSWRWTRVDAARASASVRWLTSGITCRGARGVVRLLDGLAPAAVAARAFGRLHDALVHAILREPADLIYGGTAGALAAVADAGRRSGTAFAIDFEDFHCGEHVAGDGSRRNRLADRIMRDVLRDAAFVTAGSAAIADACQARFHRAPLPVHNVFPLPAPPSPAADGPIRFYWFSQTIGANRGLEDVIGALGRLQVPCEMHLRGVPANGYVGRLHAYAAERAPALRLELHAPAAPDAMVDACRPFTIGLATEPGHTDNNARALSNKALTYPLAGLPVVFTGTPGQRALRHDLGEGAIDYPAGDEEALAARLHAWMTSPAARARAHEASWEAARRRWHWEHASERGALLAAVARIVA